MAIRIVLAEDHLITRQGLRALLERREGMEVVGEASDGREVLALVRQLRPDVVVMDITMPNLNGLEATRQIHQELPGTHVVILSMHGGHGHVTGALQAGASAYVLKECPFDELVHAIELVLSGTNYLSPKATQVVVADLAGETKKHTVDPLGRLSSQERHVLQKVAEGKTTKQIAIEIHKTAKAVEGTRRRILQKLGVNGTAEMVGVAIQTGLTSVDFQRRCGV